MGQQEQRANGRESGEIAATMQDSEASGPAIPLSSIEALGTARAMAPESLYTLRTPPPPEALSAFATAIERARYPSPKLPAWWLATAIKKLDGLCTYCGQDAGSAPDMDAVIPVAAGGPQRPNAAVLTCKGCKQERRRRDLLLWKPNASSKLRAMRANLALDAWNHLSRDPAAMQTPAKATDLINARWRHPRFHCHGTVLSMGGFIGWRDASQVPSAIQLRLVFDHGAWRLRQSVKHTLRRNNTAAIFWVPTQQGALDALWDVIEHNGLVRCADLGTWPTSAEAAQPEPVSDWAIVFPTVADLVRRRRRP